MKTVVITGTASGMGLAASKLFLNNGWRILMVDANVRQGERQLQELQKLSNDVYFHYCDITQAAQVAQVAQVAQFAFANFGRVYSVINNAGIWRGGELHTGQPIQ